MSNLPSEAVAMMRQGILNDPSFVREIAQMAGLPNAAQVEQNAELVQHQAQVLAEAVTAQNQLIAAMREEIANLKTTLERDATTQQKGVTWFAGDGAATSGRAVQATDKRLHRIEYANGTVATTTRLTFNPPFAAPPIVDAAPIWVGPQMVVGYATNITATGCDVTVMRSRSTLLLSSGPFEAAPVGTAFRMLLIGR